jgi:hypothetical protein
VAAEAATAQGRQADLVVAVHLTDRQAALEPAGKAIQVHLAGPQLLAMKQVAAEAQAQQELKDLKWSLPKAETAAAVKVLALVVRL